MTRRLLVGAALVAIAVVVAAAMVLHALRPQDEEAVILRRAEKVVYGAFWILLVGGLVFLTLRYS